MIPEAWRGRGVVAVIGLGKSGVAATRLLAREGVRVYASDAADHPYGGDALAELRGLAGVDVDVGRHDLAKIRATRAVVVSPGVPPDAPPLAAARAAGVPILSEIDLGFLALAGTGVAGAGPRAVAITGTNGKATTTAVLELARGAAGRHVLFSLRRPADGWYDAAGRRLLLGGRALLDRDALPLLGDHNVANALAAALAVHEAGVAPGVIGEGLRSFRALPHRLEPVREVNGVLWINDSKATNIASTVVAVEAMSRPLVLLLGGRHKGEPYTRLGPLLKPKCRLVIAYGESGPLVEQDLKGQVPLERGTTFDDVVARARRAARPGDAVLLSPACSSYDMFKNYEERGTTFRKLVEQM